MQTKNFILIMSLSGYHKCTLTLNKIIPISIFLALQIVVFNVQYKSRTSKAMKHAYGALSIKTTDIIYRLCNSQNRALLENNTKITSILKY